MGARCQILCRRHSSLFVEWLPHRGIRAPTLTFFSAPFGKAFLMRTQTWFAIVVCVFLVGTLKQGLVWRPLYSGRGLPCAAVQAQCLYRFCSGELPPSCVHATLFFS